jgi:hypothetical protein
MNKKDGINWLRAEADRLQAESETTHLTHEFDAKELLALAARDIADACEQRMLIQHH